MDTRHFLGYDISHRTETTSLEPVKDLYKNADLSRGNVQMEINNYMGKNKLNSDFRKKKKMFKNDIKLRYECWFDQFKLTIP